MSASDRLLAAWLVYVVDGAYAKFDGWVLLHRPAESHTDAYEVFAGNETRRTSFAQSFGSDDEALEWFPQDFARITQSNRCRVIELRREGLSFSEFAARIEEASGGEFKLHRRC